MKQLRLYTYVQRMDWSSRSVGDRKRGEREKKQEQIKPQQSLIQSPLGFLKVWLTTSSPKHHAKSKVLSADCGFIGQSQS